MKQFLLLLFFLNTIVLSAQNQSITTYYFIRHAEKIQETSDSNPKLTEQGYKRANYWSEVFKNIHFDEIFSTNYNRTLATAIPTATSKNLEITLYDPINTISEDFLNATKGKSVLIVGHSNTIPNYVNTIIGHDKYIEIEETNNSNLYIVTIANNLISDVLLHIAF